MIELPTQRRLERRRERLYAHLESILHHASVQKVENIMRQIHSINQRLRTYFKGSICRQPQELFINPLEDNDITTQNSIKSEIAPTLKEIVDIEEQIKAGEIEI